MQMQEYGLIGNATAQKFYFEYQTEGFYKITALHTGKSLTVKENNLVEGTDIVQYDYQALDSQKWILRDTHINGWIISLLSNPDLSITVNSNIQNGAKLILSNTQNDTNQMFYINDLTSKAKIKNNGIYQIAVGYNPNEVMEIGRK